MSTSDFLRVDGPQPHFRRHKEILASHPEVRELSGPFRVTPVFIVALVAVQLAIAYVVRDQPWWLVLVVAYVGGAMFAHALYVMIHDATHNLVARSTGANRLWAILCDVPLMVPGAMMFRTYHLLHHRHMGQPDLDADMPALFEARLVGNSWWRKAIWMLLFGLSQGLRPLKVKAGRTVNAWEILNLLVVVAVAVGIIHFWGARAFLFLLASTLFGLGLHPFGGRWIQEHYVTNPGQETYSYYGLGNIPAFNVGYHTEHHDFMNVAWVNLPKIHRLAPEFYDRQASYRSWTALLLRFIFSPELSPFSRIVHPAPAPARVRAG